jgi:hypothetical protein
MIAVASPRWNGKETVSDVQRQSIAEVVIDRPGVYTIEVKANEGGFYKYPLTIRFFK